MSLVSKDESKILTKWRHKVGISKCKWLTNLTSYSRIAVWTVTVKSRSNTSTCTLIGTGRRVTVVCMLHMYKMFVTKYSNKTLKHIQQCGCKVPSIGHIFTLSMFSLQQSNALSDFIIMLLLLKVRLYTGIYSYTTLKSNKGYWNKPYPVHKKNITRTSWGFVQITHKLWR